MNLTSYLFGLIVMWSLIVGVASIEIGGVSRTWTDLAQNVKEATRK